MYQSTYNINESYDENYYNGPFVDFDIPKNINKFSQDKHIKLLDCKLNSPIGIPAGPLLNANYINLYAKLGFDVLTYKTVRTIERHAHPQPNCLFINNKKYLTPEEINTTVYSTSDKIDNIDNINITNSFGMPSKTIEIWQSDIEQAQHYLKNNQLMIVSCVGSETKKRSIVDDFVLCAIKAVEAGAKVIELNYSCPNVISKESKIYQDYTLSSKISEKVKKAIKNIPLIIKIGYISDKTLLLNIIKSNAPFIEGISAINTITMQIKNKQGHQALPGENRLKSGVCGKMIKQLSFKMLKNIRTFRKTCKFDFIIISNGGITCTEDINEFLCAGSDIVMSGTGSMWNPLLAHNWKKSQTHK